MPKDYYKILGVEKNASAEEIKKAFRRLAHEHHPDKGGDAQKFKDVYEAYQVLGDEQKRAQYDKFGSAAFEPGFGVGGPGFGGFGGFGPEGFSVNMGDFGDIGDIFGEMFGFSGKRQRQKRGSDIQVDAHLDFLDAVKGTRRSVKLYKHVVCFHCGGEGGEPGSKIVTCPTCKGKGEVERTQRTIFGTVKMSSTCPECHGAGQRAETLCKICKGTGVERKEKVIEIEIPSGVGDQETLKVLGEGEHPGKGGRPGDLYIRLHIKPHPVFLREGSDVHSTVHLPYSTLALGGAVEIDTVDGPGELKIPTGTKPGTIFKLRGKGVPFYRSHGRGDHLVTVMPLVKDKLTGAQKKLLEDLKREGL